MGPARRRHPPALHPVALRHDSEHPQVARRFELVFDLLREVVSSVEQVQAEGEGDLAQLLDLVMLGDFLSLELAAQEGIDPGPVPAINELKLRLGQLPVAPAETILAPDVPAPTPTMPSEAP